MASAPPETGSPPPRLMRKLVFALLSLIGFCTLILVILSYVVSLDRVKGKIVAHIEAALQRKVDVSTVRLQIVGGLGVRFEELTVYNPPGWQQAHLLNVETLSLKVAWLPLLQRKIAITKIMLSNGDIVLEREPQGRLAFADHAEASADTTNISPALPLQPSRQTTVQPPASPLTNLVVANVARKDVKFIYIDGKVIAGKAMTTTVSAGQLHLPDIALGIPSPCNMVATLVSNSRHNVRLHGNLGPIAANLTSNGVPVAGHLQATDVLLRQLIPCLGPEFSLIQGRIGTDVTVQGNLSGGLRINESLSLTDAMLWPALAEGA